MRILGGIAEVIRILNEHSGAKKSSAFANTGRAPANAIR
jgi:hypothetical protein